MTLYQIKTTKQKLIENFFATFVVLLALMNTLTSFYLFTLTGKVFRKEFKLLSTSNRQQATIQSIMTMPTTIKRNISAHP